MMRVLCESAILAQERYRKSDINDDIFTATFQCFSRFVREHHESYGTYGFDRWYWVGRQLSLRLFRIRQLEYELSELDGAPAVSLHIPSDCLLDADQIDTSLAAAEEFLSKRFPQYRNVRYFCNSWLLSPALATVLPDSSRIVQFGKRFTVVKTFPEDNGYIQWVYKDKTLSPEQFPEHTSLQRNLKTFVLAGGNVGAALGILP